MSYNILVAEDEQEIAELLKLYLENEGYKVFWAKDGIEALELVEKEEINMAVLDIMMPRMDGYELTRRIRENSNMPILILSARGQSNDKILGLNLGADDYISKPFDPLEIVARVNSGLRRFYRLSGKSAEDDPVHVLKVGDLELDTQTLILKKRGKEVMLTPMEYKILAMLMKNPGTIYTKVQIYESVSGEYFESDDNTIMVHISNLRDKIEDNPKDPCYIKTIRGVGYKIENR
ncbi:MAG: response regulator transcription factor [Blautia sp.]